MGPALGGLLIAALGVGWAYAVDAASCFALVGAVLGMSPQPPQTAPEATSALPVGRSIAEGLRFVRGEQALMGSFAIDLLAMTFGMPRALFPALAVGVYGAGAEGAGLLYAAVSAGATVAALTTGWLGSARRLGRIVVWAVVAWGAAIALAGLAGSLWVAAALLAVAGAADSVSAVCRSTINQTVTPDAMRGRMSSVFSLVVTSGPRLGDVEAGGVAGLDRPALLRRLRRPGLRGRRRSRSSSPSRRSCATTPRRRSRRSPSARPSPCRPERRDAGLGNDEGPAVRGPREARRRCAYRLLTLTALGPLSPASAS